MAEVGDDRRRLLAAVVARSRQSCAAIAAARAGERDDHQLRSHDLDHRRPGGHPDLDDAASRSPTRADPEAAKDVTVNLPEGVFGNPNAVAKCTLRRLRAQRNARPTPRSGLITIRANYDGNPNNLLGTAPIYNMDARGDDETARLRLHRPDRSTSRSTIPISGPHRRRLRPALDRHRNHPGDPARRRADITIWGFPADPEHDNERFPKGSPGQPGRLPGRGERRLRVQRRPNPQPSHLRSRR